MRTSFTKTLLKCFEEYCKFPKWQRKYVISSEACKTGKFLGKDLKIQNSKETKKIMKFIRHYNLKVTNLLLKWHRGKSEYTCTTTNKLMDCPKCGQCENMEYTNRGWNCLMRDCQYHLPEEYYTFINGGLL